MNLNLNVGHPDFLIERHKACFIGNFTEQNLLIKKYYVIEAKFVSYSLTFKN